jgi:hypothetical protein
MKAHYRVPPVDCILSQLNPGLEGMLEVTFLNDQNVIEGNRNHTLHCLERKIQAPEIDYAVTIGDKEKKRENR